MLDGGKSFQQGEPTRIQGVQSATASQQMDSSFQIMRHNLIGQVAPKSAAQKAAEKQLAAAGAVEPRADAGAGADTTPRRTASRG